MLAIANQADYEPIPADEVIPKLVDQAVKVFDVYHSKNIMTDAVFERTSPENARKIYEMLDALHQIMTKNGIAYWMDGGTILGAERHGGLIPWDDDGDLEIFEKDKEKLLSLASEFATLGYKLVDHEFGLKLFPNTGYFPSIDIFTVTKDSESGKYVLANEKAKKQWPKEFWTEEELGEIVPYQFGPIKLMGCKKTDRYLSTLYGKNYKDIAYQLYNHGENKMHYKKAVRIVDRNPARI
jgi:phosphorylcholine metabolism protein LicD